MLEDAKVIAAIVAGIVSLIISGVSGIYTVVKSRKRFEELKKELLVKSSVSSYIEKKESFLDTYRKFEKELNDIVKRNPKDGTEVLQFAIDFYVTKGRDFYLRNKRVLESKRLNELLENITETIDSGSLNTPENNSEKREFGLMILSFLNELNDQTLKTN